MMSIPHVAANHMKLGCLGINTKAQKDLLTRLKPNRSSLESNRSVLSPLGHERNRIVAGALHTLEHKTLYK